MNEPGAEDTVVSRLRASYQSAPTREQRMAAAAARRRRNAVIGIAVAAALAVGVGVVMTINLLRDTPPTAQPSSTPTATPNSANETPGGPPEIALVGGDLLADPPEGVPITIPENTVIAATEVGARAGYTAYGLVGDSNKVCLLIEHEGASTGDCTTYAEFERRGLTVDRVDWQVRWWADGRLEWVGLAED